MSQFQTLLRSRDSPLNIQTLILVVIIDATIPMPELANGYVDSIPCTNKTLKILLFKMCFIFEDNNMFVDDFNTSFKSYQSTP